MNKQEHKHDKVFTEICDYLGGDMDSEMCKEVKDHLDSCPECKTYFDSIKKTITICRDSEDIHQASDECKEKIIENIKLEVLKRKR